MNRTAAMNNSGFLINLEGSRKGAITMLVFLFLIGVLLALLFKNLSSSSLNPIIKEACTKTLYSSLCFDSISSVPISKNPLTFHGFLEFLINQTKNSVEITRTYIMVQFENQDSTSQVKNAHRDCIEILDQTLYELGQAIDHLHKFPSSYGNLKTLLSAAMTNENTCIDGFSDLESQKGLKEQFQSLLTPISRMISNSLAMINYMENINGQETVQNPRMLIKEVQEDRTPDWMTNADMKMVEIPTRRRRRRRTSADVIVASDGSGDYTFITEAIGMTPNMSMKRYVIKIKSGIYEENVIIPREKINLIFIGDGMNKTIIKGSRNIVDGYSTFASATLSMLLKIKSVNF